MTTQFSNSMNFPELISSTQHLYKAFLCLFCKYCVNPTVYVNALLSGGGCCNKKDSTISLLLVTKVVENYSSNESREIVEQGKFLS